MPYTKCFYHLIWATKHRQAVITPVYETLIFEAIREKCEEMGCELLAVNAAWDHVHVAVTIPASLSIAQVTGNLKGNASRMVNAGFENEERFRWQESYSAFTFGEKALSDVVSYIHLQKEHHRDGTIHAYYEVME
jgi:putative transposase